MPVHKIYEEMTYEELLGWYNYFERRPVGWREDDRIYKVLQTQGAKEKPWKYFNSLDPIYNQRQKQKQEDGKFSMSELKGSSLFSKMLSAKGGDTLDVWSA
jgi:hypothetical protein